MGEEKREREKEGGEWSTLNDVSCRGDNKCRDQFRPIS